MNGPAGEQSRHGRIRTRRGILLMGWVVLAGIMMARLVEVQILERQAWVDDAQRQHRLTRAIPAPRGRILDRNGSELAVSHWQVRVAIAPHEVEDFEAVAAALETHLGASLSPFPSAPGAERRWHFLPGRYSFTEVAPLRGLRGVHIESELRRLYPGGALARGVLGVVIDGAGAGGIEQSMDSVLAGRSGREVVARDNEGRQIPGDAVTLMPPTAGLDVVLTIDQDLQAISEDALADALAATGARAGDLVITDPRTGEILAMISVDDTGRSTLSAVHTPFEPGSTIKPFTTAALLRHDLAALTDSVDTQQGRWRVNGRTITDVTASGWMTLHEVVRESSNIGIARFAERLSAGQQYTALRDFGFGTETGVGLPGEVSGTLRLPGKWSATSAHSLAYGYEIAVTPLQMALAYGALANGGLLMEPRIVREIRNEYGEPRHYGRARVIRQVVPQWVTEKLTPVLVDVVDRGTGTRARLSSFQVAGKSGTARATGSDNGYEEGAYYASFGAYFPADDPQLLFFVRLDRPDSAYYGGETAAPVTRSTLQNLLSATRIPVDRGKLARARRDRPVFPPVQPLVRFASTDLAEPGGGVVPISWSSLPARLEIPADASEQPLILPDLEGVPMRVALRRLHKMGLRVRAEGGGRVAAVFPGEGVEVAAGDTVRVVGGR